MSHLFYFIYSFFFYLIFVRLFCIVVACCCCCCCCLLAALPFVVLFTFHFCNIVCTIYASNIIIIQLIYIHTMCILNDFEPLQLFGCYFYFYNNYLKCTSFVRCCCGLIFSLFFFIDPVAQFK